MSEILKPERTPIALELVPVAMQLAGLAALLVAVRENLPYSIGSVFLGLTWLSVSRSNMTDEYGNLRLRRALFVRLGTWLNRDDPGAEFDNAQSETLLMDGNLEDDRYKAVVTAAGAANLLRGGASIALHLYLAYLVFSFLKRYVGA